MIPKTIKIGPVKYKIHLDSDRCTDNNYDYGFIKCKTGEIFINPEVHQDQQKDTLLHEIIHGIFELLGLQKNPVLDLNEEKEEMIVTPLASILLDVLRSNPKLVEYLMEK